MKKFHNLPIESGDTFYINDGKSIRECTFVNVGITYSDCRLAAIYYLDEEDNLCMMKKCMYTEHVKFYKTLHDAITGQNNILPKYRSIIDNNALYEFLTECGFSPTSSEANCVNVFVCCGNSVRRCNGRYDIKFNRIGEPCVVLQKVETGFRTYSKPYTDIENCIKDNNIVIKLKNKK